MIWLTIPLITFAFMGCVESTQIIVRDKTGAAVSQAEVYINEARAGVTDASGTLTVALDAGARLFARKLMYERPSYRLDHGPGQGWVMRAYQTSLVVQNDGSRVDVTAGPPPATETLTLDPLNALIGVHLVVSLDWDASDAELEELRKRFVAASEYLYNLTDGQFLIEQIELADDTQMWNSAEYTLRVDNTTRPFATYPGGFLGPVAFGSPTIKIAPFADNGFNSTEPQTIIHEFGHLAFGLQDEYVGFGVGPHFCTQNLNSATSGEFMYTGPKAGCAMDRQMGARKLCSNHPSNPHHGGTYQLGSCWDTIRFGGYNDPTGIPARWTLQTPDTRGAIPGTLPPIPAGLRPVINITNRKLHDLCEPFKFTDPLGAAMANGTVWVRPLFWGGDFTLGRLDYSGSLMARGVHMGDVIKTPGSIVPVNASNCVRTN